MVGHEVQVTGGVDVAPHGEQAVGMITTEAQIQVASHSRRDVPTCLRTIEEILTASPEAVGMMGYSFSRGGQQVRGYSVRAAEVCAYAWGNVRVWSGIIRETPDLIVGGATCHDVEANIVAAREVARPIVTAQGRRYGVDMIRTTGNAAAAIALRNAIFTVIPLAVVGPVLDRVARLGQQAPPRGVLGDWPRMVEAFQAVGVSQTELLDFVGAAAPDQIDVKQWDALRRYYAAKKSEKNGRE